MQVPSRCPAHNDERRVQRKWAQLGGGLKSRLCQLCHQGCHASGAGGTSAMQQSNHPPLQAHQRIWVVQRKRRGQQRDCDAATNGEVALHAARVVPLRWLGTTRR